MTENFPSVPRILAIHPVFDFKGIISSWGEAVECVQVASRREAGQFLPEADILLTMLWQNEFLEGSSRLRYIQSVTSGVEQFDLDAIRARDIRLCNARGANAIAVAEHALALMLGFARHLPMARDDQKEKLWRRLDVELRRREIYNSHIVIVGYGAIGQHLVSLCRALGAMVTVVRRNVEAASGLDGVRFVGNDSLSDVVKSADYLVLACPLTDDTRGLVNAQLLKAMKADATLINVGRGGLVVEADLVAALTEGRIGGAGLDTFIDEPLPESSPFWMLPNVVVTPHQAGESSMYEYRVCDILRENIEKLRNGASGLLNEVV